MTTRRQFLALVGLVPVAAVVPVPTPAPRYTFAIDPGGPSYTGVAVFEQWHGRTQRSAGAQTGRRRSGALTPVEHTGFWSNVVIKRVSVRVRAERVSVRVRVRL